MYLCCKQSYLRIMMLYEQCDSFGSDRNYMVHYIFMIVLHRVNNERS